MMLIHAIVFISLFLQGNYVSGATWSTTTLFVKRWQLSATSVGNMTLFAGGYGGFETYSPTVSNIVDIYFANNNTWSVATLPVARQQLAATTVGNYAIFAGGNTGTAAPPIPSAHVDIYEASTNTWSTDTLSARRYDLAATSVGDLALFAGGVSGESTYGPKYNTVDIFNATSRKWTTATLSQNRSRLAAVRVANLAIFAGGFHTDYSNQVDIYDYNSNTWSTTQLPGPARTLLAAASVRNLALFAGGSIGSDINRVDIYNADLRSWLQSRTLSAPRRILAATSLGDMAIFGFGARYSPNVDIYHANNDSWTLTTIEPGRYGHAATSVGGFAIFAGGRGEDGDALIDKVDILFHCQRDEDCADTVFCNGVERCLDGYCVEGVSPCGSSVCNDTCNEEAKTCERPFNTNCDDGVFCNGDDYCDSGICLHRNNACSNMPKCQRRCIESNDTCGYDPPPISCENDGICIDGACVPPTTSSTTTSTMSTSTTTSTSSSTSTSTTTTTSSTSTSSTTSSSTSSTTSTSTSSITSSSTSSTTSSSTSSTTSTSTSSTTSTSTSSTTSSSTSSTTTTAAATTASTEVSSNSEVLRVTTTANVESSNDVVINDTTIIVIVLIPTTLIIVAILAIVFLVHRRKKTDGRRGPEEGSVELQPPSQASQPLTKTPSLNPNASTLTLGTSGTPTPLLPAEHVTIVKKLGEGNFGEVYLGTYFRADVALKKLKDNEGLDEFQRELALLITLQHPNIVRCFGMTIKDDQPYMVTEFVSGGSLLDLLKQKGDDFKFETHINLILNIVMGMLYLENNKIVHRDLACRNCLVAPTGKNTYQVKVADFGMSRQVDRDEYTAKHAKVPVRWSAPEVLKEGQYSTKADVWSFGIVMWEIFACGDVPYGRWKSNKEVVEDVLQGIRLQRPANCPTKVFDIMQECWQQDPAKRPSFDGLVNKITAITQDEKEYEKAVQQVEGEGVYESPTQYNDVSDYKSQPF